MFDKPPKQDVQKSDPVLMYERIKFLCNNSVYKAERTPSLMLTHGAAQRLRTKIKQLRQPDETIKITLLYISLGCQIVKQKGLTSLDVL